MVEMPLNDNKTKPFFVHFCIFFVSLKCYVYNILNAGRSSSYKFSWDTLSVDVSSLKQATRKLHFMARGRTIFVNNIFLKLDNFSLTPTIHLTFQTNANRQSILRSASVWPYFSLWEG